MKDKKIMTLQDNMVAAIESDVKFIVCTMSLSVMGMQARDIMPLPNIRYGGVASFVEEAASSDLSLMF